ncbi:uncharacterized protein [Palaemon carinicauda]|uniref:uncharacterized protein n=1 Tax=Palaemon carinicauda TaxID=392227 RepID=UPI0035B5E91A
MKMSGRAVFLNGIFLLFVAFLVSLQIYLQYVQRNIGEAASVDVDNIEKSYQRRSEDFVGGNIVSQIDHIGEEVAAAPVFPNIRKSFPKRKAPYLRKGKKNKKKKQKMKKGNQQKYGGSVKEDIKSNTLNKGKRPNFMKLEIEQGKKRKNAGGHKKVGKKSHL